jgi:hypothetical protein
VADAREPEAEGVFILEGLRMSRRGFLRLSIAGIAGLSLFGTLGCGGGQDSGGGNGKKDKEGGGGGGY